MAVSTQPQPTRTVVLLRAAERKRLEKLAASEKVSAGEILRRSLRAYEQPLSKAEDQVAALLLAEMNESLDKALESLRSAHASIRENLSKIEAMEIQQATQKHKRERE